MPRFPLPDGRSGAPRSRLARQRGDEGFTLVEVIVAFVIIAIVASAGTSLTISSLRATYNAKELTQAKDLVNQQIEEMQGLPYWVKASNGTTQVDVLDKYFPNTVRASKPTCSANAEAWATTAAWRGYVTDSTERCDFEPAVPFYRTIIDSPSASGRSALVVNTQFIGLATGAGTKPASVAPPEEYSAATIGMDTAAASQVSATVTAIYGPDGGTAKRTTSRTDIADRMGAPALVSGDTAAAAVIVDGKAADGSSRRLTLGSVTGSGAVTEATSATVEAVGASMQSEGVRTDGASELAMSPGSLTGSSSYGGRNWLSMSIGPTTTDSVLAPYLAARPGFGSPTAMARASAQSGSFSLDQNNADLGLTTADPIVTVQTTGGAIIPATGQCPSAFGAGAIGGAWMRTGAATDATRRLDTCAGSKVSTVQLFPKQSTAWSQGLIQIQASDVTARCEVSNASTPTRVATGELTVLWLDLSSSWQSKTIKLKTDGTPDGSLPDLDTVLANEKTIGHYVQRWEAFNNVEIPTPISIPGGRSATAKIPAALTLTTVPVRTLEGVPDAESSVRLTVGQAMCSAVDRRLP